MRRRQLRAIPPSPRAGQPIRFQHPDFGAVPAVVLRALGRRGQLGVRIRELRPGAAPRWIPSAWVIAAEPSGFTLLGPVLDDVLVGLLNAGRA